MEDLLEEISKYERKFGKSKKDNEQTYRADLTDANQKVTQAKVNLAVATEVVVLLQALTNLFKMYCHGKDSESYSAALEGLERAYNSAMSSIVGKGQGILSGSLMTHLADIYHVVTKSHMEDLTKAKCNFIRDKANPEDKSKEEVYLCYCKCLMSHAGIFLRGIRGAGSFISASDCFFTDTESKTCEWKYERLAVASEFTNCKYEYTVSSTGVSKISHEKRKNTSGYDEKSHEKRKNTSGYDKKAISISFNSLQDEFKLVIDDTERAKDLDIHTVIVQCEYAAFLLAMLICYYQLSEDDKQIMIKQLFEMLNKSLAQWIIFRRIGAYIQQIITKFLQAAYEKSTMAEIVEIFHIDMSLICKYALHLQKHRLSYQSREDLDTGLYVISIDYDVEEKLSNNYKFYVAKKSCTMQRGSGFPLDVYLGQETVDLLLENALCKLETCLLKSTSIRELMSIALLIVLCFMRMISEANGPDDLRSIWRNIQTLSTQMIIMIRDSRLLIKDELITLIYVILENFQELETCQNKDEINLLAKYHQIFTSMQAVENVFDIQTGMEKTKRRAGMATNENNVSICLLAPGDDSKKMFSFTAPKVGAVQAGKTNPKVKLADLSDYIDMATCLSDAIIILITGLMSFDCNNQSGYKDLVKKAKDKFDCQEGTYASYVLCYLEQCFKDAFSTKYVVGSESRRAIVNNNLTSFFQSEHDIGKLIALIPDFVQIEKELCGKNLSDMEIIPESLSAAIQEIPSNDQDPRIKEDTNPQPEPTMPESFILEKIELEWEHIYGQDFDKVKIIKFSSNGSIKTVSRVDLTKVDSDNLDSLLHELIDLALRDEDHCLMKDQELAALIEAVCLMHTCFKHKLSEGEKLGPNHVKWEKFLCYLGKKNPSLQNVAKSTEKADSPLTAQSMVSKATLTNGMHPHCVPSNLQFSNSLMHFNHDDGMGGNCAIISLLKNDDQKRLYPTDDRALAVNFDELVKIFEHTYAAAKTVACPKELQEVFYFLAMFVVMLMALRGFDTSARERSNVKAEMIRKVAKLLGRNLGYDSNSVQSMIATVQKAAARGLLSIIERIASLKTAMEAIDMKPIRYMKMKITVNGQVITIRYTSKEIDSQKSKEDVDDFDIEERFFGQDKSYQVLVTKKAHLMPILNKIQDAVKEENNPHSLAIRNALVSCYMCIRQNQQSSEEFLDALKSFFDFLKGQFPSMRGQWEAYLHCVDQVVDNSISNGYIGFEFVEELEKEVNKTLISLKKAEDQRKEDNERALQAEKDLEKIKQEDLEREKQKLIDEEIQKKAKELEQENQRLKLEQEAEYERKLKELKDSAALDAERLKLQQKAEQEAKEREKELQRQKEEMERLQREKSEANLEEERKRIAKLALAEQDRLKKEQEDREKRVKELKDKEAKEKAEQGQQGHHRDHHRVHHHNHSETRVMSQITVPVGEYHYTFSILNDQEMLQSKIDQTAAKKGETEEELSIVLKLLSSLNFGPQLLAMLLVAYLLRRLLCGMHAVKRDFSIEKFKQTITASIESKRIMPTFWSLIEECSSKTIFEVANYILEIKQGLMYNKYFYPEQVASKTLGQINMTLSRGKHGMLAIARATPIRNRGFCLEPHVSQITIHHKEEISVQPKTEPEEEKDEDQSEREGIDGVDKMDQQ